LKKHIFILTIFCLSILTEISYAQIYQWVDKDGKTRFSDKPPPNHPDDTSINVEEKAAKKSGLGQDKLLLAGNNTRPVILETIRYKIQSSALDESIGKRFQSDSRVFPSLLKVPSECLRGESQPLTTLYAKRVLAGAIVQSQAVFHRLLKRQGYSVADQSDSVFANQESNLPELSIAALIRSANFENCRTRYHGYTSYSKAEFTIEWQVFDNLKREVLFSGQSIGDGDNHNGKPSSEGGTDSFEAAFMAAAENLLKNPEFRDAINSESLSTITVISDAAVEVKLNYGNSTQSFLDLTDQIEKGTVTVRTAGGHGSGFFISSDGYVITNRHVVQGSPRVLVLTSDAEFYGQVVRVDKQRDVALIKVDITTDFPLKISQRDVRVGEQIYVVGTPLSEQLSFSVTRGIISGKRSKNGLPLLQTDAAVNPGNSGGPVLNEFGDVIAISVSGIFSASGGSLNTNFLIPIHDALLKLGIDQ